VASVYVSPFVRTVQTAHYMLEEMSELHPREGGRLMSIEYGLAGE
jgi:phosphohistidine phosphatase SixA